MAEIEFFADGTEIIEGVAWLNSQRCALVPDLHYDSNEITRLNDPSRVNETAASSPHFFVIREDLLESPLSLRHVTAEDKHFFYIDPRTGGPSLQFYWGRSFTREGREHASASWLSYYPWYEDSVTGERKKICQGLVEIYTGFGKMIRSRSRRIQPGKRQFWITPSMEKSVRAGLILAGFESLTADRLLGAQSIRTTNQG